MYSTVYVRRGGSQGGGWTCTESDFQAAIYNCVLTIDQMKRAHMKEFVCSDEHTEN